MLKAVSVASLIRLASSRRYQEVLFLLLCAAILALQLFLPGFIGMANNGDFPKVAGRLCLGSADRETENFVYFQPDYLRGPTHCYDPHIPSSEIAPAWLASSLEQAAGDPGRFDIRWLGAIHALLFAGFYFSVLVLLRPLSAVARIVLSLTALWIFADVGLVSYFNSFYSDVPAILGGLAAAVLAVLLMANEKIHVGLFVLFGLASLMFVTSKGQHTILGLVPLATAMTIGWRSRDRFTRLAGWAVSLALAAGMLCVFAATPDWFGAQAKFNLIFNKIARNSRTPLQDLRALGLNDRDLRYVGMHAYLPDGPMQDIQWRDAFGARSSYARVLGFYFRHPYRTLEILWSDLRAEAWMRRVFGNFPKSYGRPPGSQTDRLSSWSSMRSWLFIKCPAHMLAWYALALLAPPFLAMHAQSRFQRSLLWTIAALSVLGALEFGVSSLADGVETFRHLLMFHVFTDAAMFLALVLAAGRLERRWRLVAVSEGAVAATREPLPDGRGSE